MDSPAFRVPLRPPASGAQRLVLAVAGAGAMVTLCWAALQVRAAREEARLAREERNAAAAPPPIPAAAPEPSAIIQNLENRLAEEQSLRQKAETNAAARQMEMEKVISFLRQENEAAQKTIERLSHLDPATGPGEEPVETNTFPKSRDR